MSVKGFVPVVPEMDAVSDAQEQTIIEFLAALRQHYKATTESEGAASGSALLPLQWRTLESKPEDMRILAYKYLTARKWKVADALEMATTTATWRTQHQVDALALFPPAFPVYGYDADDVLNVLGDASKRRSTAQDDWFAKAGRLIDPVYKSGFHYWDKTGHPVLIMFFGQCSVRGLFKAFQQLSSVGQKPTHAAVRYHSYENEVAASLAVYRDAVNAALPAGHPDKVDRRILGVTCVIDCSGLGYSHLWTPILDILRSEFAVDAAHYPEGLHRVIVVNCPTMIKFAYTIVKGALDPRVQQKITFCSTGKETEETMKLVMDVKHLPTFLGGEWVCPDGKHWGPDVDPTASPMGSAGSKDDGSDVVTEDISVSAGSAHVKEYLLAANEEVSWEFASTSGYDIRFQVQFFPGSTTLCSSAANNNDHAEPTPPLARDEASAELVIQQKLKDGADRYVASTQGVLRLTWDNTSSWFKGKKLQMRIIKSAPLDTSES